MENNCWYPLINGKSYRFFGKVDEVIAQLKELEKEHESDLAAIVENYGDLEAQKQQLLGLSEQAKTSGAMAGFSRGLAIFFKAIFKFIKGFWKSFKVLGRIGKKLRNGCFMFFVFIVFTVLTSKEAVLLRELALPYFICFVALILALYLISKLNSNEEDSFELMRATEVAAVTASIPLIVQRTKSLIEVLEVLSEDVKEGATVIAKLFYQPARGGPLSKLESRMIMEVPMSDGNEVVLECGFEAQKGERPKGQKLKPCLIFQEKLDIVVKVQGEQFKAGVKARKAKAIGPFRNLEMKGPQLVGSGKERVIGTSMRAVDKIANVPNLQAKAEHILQALSFLYGALRTKKPPKPVRPKKPVVAPVAVVIEKPAEEPKPEVQKPEAAGNAAPDVSKPATPRTLAELVDLILADGVLTAAEKKFVEKVIAHDGKYTQEEKAQIARIQKLVREGKVRYEK